MKKLFLLSFLILLSACKKTEEKKDSKQEPAKKLTIAKKIANAHGYENWSKVKTFAFTFGGIIEDSTSGRSWVWNPKTNIIKMSQNGETIEYNRNSMDSVALNADRAFINDKFWALIPFQLIWDEGTTISESTKEKSPINQQDLNKITITYANEGGYTPGDAYDIYFDDNYIIREWSYKQNNAPEPSLSNTFENYSDHKGIKIAQEHKFAEGNKNLLIRNVKIELQD
jgi:hypothetical protein